MRRFVNWLASFALLLSAAPALAGSSQPTVVFVHGAFTDGSSWARVIAILQAQHVSAVAVQTPLTSLADDAAAVQRAIARAPGPVVLVGHSWGGAVISEVGGDDKVAALVYVAATVPDRGQSVNDLAVGEPVSPGVGQIQHDEPGFLYLSEVGVRRDFAQDLPLAERDVIVATQGLIFHQAFADKLTAAAWRSKPSWYLVSTQDRMILPDVQRRLAERIGATVGSVDASHLAMLSKPQEVADFILKAVAAVSAGKAR